jgi:hypothetical protein
MWRELTSFLKYYKLDAFKICEVAAIHFDGY